MNNTARDILQALKTPPRRGTGFSLLLLTLFGAAALAIGLSADLFEPELLHSNLAPILPFTLLLFPAIPEELFFRGLFIHPSQKGTSRRNRAVQLFSSSLLFMLWHPLNAWLINHGARPLFYDPAFLLITFLLGITCGAAYLRSRSLWTPILIHWSTVMVWVFFLGGRNLVKEIS
ncbi:MAG: CPBP family glutamic-type intramembrane protease [Fibrobacterota bacterium]